MAGCCPWVRVTRLAQESRLCWLHGSVVLGAANRHAYYLGSANVIGKIREKQRLTVREKALELSGNGPRPDKAWRNLETLLPWEFSWLWSAQYAQVTLLPFVSHIPKVIARFSSVRCNSFVFAVERAIRSVFARLPAVGFKSI